MLSEIWFVPLIVFIITLTCSFFLSKYLLLILDGNYAGIPILNKIENSINGKQQTWQQYLISMLTFCLLIFIFNYFVLLLQPFLPLNPENKGILSPTTILHSALSFLTNTDLQHYIGEKHLSNGSQILFAISNMFLSPAIGLSVAVAMMRALRGDPYLGNFYQDVWRVIIYILIPIAFIFSIIYMQQGVPMTFRSMQQVTTLEQNTEFTQQQNIVVGPVAAFVGIKMFGVNGGGFFNMNSAHPYENPSFLTNIISNIAMMLLPFSMIFLYGRILRQIRHSYVIFVVMALGLALITGWIVYYDSKQPNPAMTHHHAKVYTNSSEDYSEDDLYIREVPALPVNQRSGNLEGKELRFGTLGSASFLGLSTSLGCGAINAEPDSLNPLAGFAPLMGMWINCFFGGVGVGLINMITYIILGIFLAGMMVGRTPEYLGKKIGTKEIQLIIISMLFKPLLILLPLGLFAATKFGMEAISNPGAHGLTQMLYQFSSAAANNGSAFNGLKVIYGFFNNPNPPSQAIAWDIITAIIIVFSRFIPIIAPVAMAAILGAKRSGPMHGGSLRIDTFVFAFILVGTLVIIGALLFIPMAMLGPIAEHLGPIPFGS